MNVQTNGPYAQRQAGRTGRNTQQPNHIALTRSNKSGDVDDFKAAIEADRQLLALGWLQPGALHDVAKRIGLRRDDFTWVAYGYLFEYIVECGERGVTPTVDECARVAAERYVEVDAESLFELILNTDIQDGELVNYAFDVQHASQDRSCALFRSLCQETLRAINRGLRIDAVHKLRKSKRSAPTTTPTRRSVYV